MRDHVKRVGWDLEKLQRPMPPSISSFLPPPSLHLLPPPFPLPPPLLPGCHVFTDDYRVGRRGGQEGGRGGGVSVGVFGEQRGPVS